MASPPRTSRVLALVAFAAAGCAATGRHSVKAPPTSPICFSCFWDTQPPGLRDELISVYADRRYDDPLAEAERRLILGRTKPDPALVCEAHGIFAGADESDPSRRLLAAESAAFLAAGCGGGVGEEFRAAAIAAREAGERLKAEVYRAIAAGRFRPRDGKQEIGRSFEIPEGTAGYVLGASSIFVPEGANVVVQSERTVRDWLSYQLGDDLSSRPVEREAIVDWHEGARLRDLMAATSIEAHPVRGTLAIREGERWLAPDEEGIFRFEVLPDKLQYPSTRVHGDLALILDTHGVSAVAGEGSRSQADLVVACGDTPAKMEAAYRLASSGVAVWFPCDRFVGDVLFHDGRGVLLGSAPVRGVDGGAIVGDTPVAFRLDERIVVEDSTARGVSQYHDAAARYFRRLSRRVPLRLDYRMVGGPGESATLVDRARATGATAIALRVATPEDAAAVRAWLAESPSHRAVLFHSAPYPAGIGLFRDFPGQTTFGDPRPVWQTPAP